LHWIGGFNQPPTRKLTQRRYDGTIMTPSPSTVQANLLAVRTKIEHAAIAAGRSGHAIQLIAVSKTKPAEFIRIAVAAGQRVFGENYVQEAEEKARELADLPIEWHFIGSLQSNKAKVVARTMHWFHGVDRLSVAQALSKACIEPALRPTVMGPLRVLIQVNISGEASKHGVAPDEATPLARAVNALPGLELCGLMGMAQPTDDATIQRHEFSILRNCLNTINSANVADKPLTVLSMGMSGDLVSAIAEGATHVRVGSAIFGARQQQNA
jgi:PLP dependent protein